MKRLGQPSEIADVVATQPATLPVTSPAKSSSSMAGAWR